jgi:hypothetical protein
MIIVWYGMMQYDTMRALDARRQHLESYQHLLFFTTVRCAPHYSEGSGGGVAAAATRAAQVLGRDAGG